MNNWATSAAFELKIARGSTFKLNQIKEHQIFALKVANNKLLYYKIEDNGFNRKPFDCFTLYQVPAYVVVHFAERGNKKFYLLDIKQIELLIKRGIKSITEEELEKLASEVGLLSPDTNHESPR